MDKDIEWDVEADVVVLGTGGSALVAALAADEFGAEDVVILEKSGMVGGTTAMSGGMLWVPGNHHELEAGATDSWDEVVAYLDAAAPGTIDPEALAGFLEGGPEMVRFLADKTPVRLHAYADYPDYQPYLPGAKADGGRSLDNDVFAFDQLGSWATRVNMSKMAAMPRLSMVEAASGPMDPEVLEAREKSDSRGMGQALIGALLKGVLDRGIPIHFEKRARKLVKDGARIAGVIAEQDGRDFKVKARRGVVIATGGFEWNQDLVNTFVRGPITGPVSVPENEGDGLLMAMEVGARLGNMSTAWWMPSVLETKAQHRNAKPNYLLGSHCQPGSIFVNRAGKRFINEASNYNALGRALHNFDASTHDYPNLPYWCVFDQHHKDSYRVFMCAPGQEAPPSFMRADTIPELAALMGVDGEALKATVERFNGFVRTGHDDDFTRGDNSYDVFRGDRSANGIHRTLGVLEKPPFYAVKMEAGVLGTSGGPKTNGRGQVLDWSNEPIEGLYAAGNVMSAVTSYAYGGAGGTIGPGMAFGFLAGRHAAAGI